MTATAADPNELKGEDWAGEMGRKWLTHIDRFEGMIAPIGDALLARAGIAPGERVIDLGCGGGLTSLVAARATGPEGAVLGLDISPDLIDEARRRAEGMSNVTFICADAATVALDAPYDRLISRFGSMFFADPYAAFTNLHALLKPGGQIDLAIWAAPRDNPWMMELMGVARSHIDIPSPDPRAPGPFAFADLDYIRDILAHAGFSAPDIEAYQGEQAIGGPGASPEEAADFALASMAIGRALAEAGEDVLARARADLVTLFEKRHVPGKGVMMANKVWLLTATA
ncbi:MAG: class I SAM-dependent methyltransferase [Blastomonas fulva]|uniref:class I SAM-dependent methyltransferase n=1 Tax=Blastomonas fulva TaxID=1550728 RepID=UPI0024E1A39E|nr:class I SAM-dependent methyltransferase [Blastomonas fulva]MDK2756900.1 class I SAM-dependent methyltransferase [Blastomonas fulva]